MPGWTPVFLLPNLRVKENVAVDEAAMVDVDDERIRAYCRQYPAFRRFVGKFTDPFGARSTPGILLLQTSARGSFRTLEAMSSFRDLVALSVIPLQRAKSIIHRKSFNVRYSDYFGFYPWNFNDKNNLLVCDTPALLGLHEVQAFKGQSSPVLSPLDLDHIDFDAPLLKELLARWRSRYGTNKPVWTDVALFRSLNMAFAACMMPAGPDVTQFHVGRSIALWVSAFEILTHTGGDKVKLYDVYDRLAAAPWREKQLRHKRHMFYGSKTKRALPCWIYGEIHHARNDFLHGNPIDRKHLIVKRSQRNLFNYAAPLYRMALTGFLPIPEPASRDPTTFSRERFDFIVNQHEIEEALSTILISSKKYEQIRKARLDRVKVTWRPTLPQHV
jgi:hypothetical protein